MSKEDYAYEIARINIFGTQPKVHVELAHMVLDNEGGARHVIPELQVAYVDWQAGEQASSPRAIGAYVMRAHPEAFNQSGNLAARDGRPFPVSSSGLPHWIYNLYAIEDARQNKTWELEVHRSRSAIKTEFHCVGTRRNLSKWNQRAVMFLEGRVTRLLYRI